MIKILAINPPILGRLSIGKIVETKGKYISEKDDQFSITTQIQGKDDWMKHSLDETLRAKSPSKKLRSIPVRMIFNDPELNLRTEQPLCPSPSLYTLAKGGLYKTYARLYFHLDDLDGGGTFIFSTTDCFNIRTLAARIAYYHAVSDGLLSCMPLQLILKTKNSTKKHVIPIYYADLILREGVLLHDAIAIAKEISEQN